MTKEELEALRASGKDPTPEQVVDYDETLRTYRTSCPHCGHHMTGTLEEIRHFYRLCDRLCKHDQTAQ